MEATFGNDFYKDFAKARFELTDSRFQKLALAKLAVAQEGLNGEIENVKVGRKLADLSTLEAGQWWLESALALQKQKASRFAVLQKNWVLVKEVEAITKQQLESGRTDITKWAPIFALALEAEIRLLEEGRPENGKPSDLIGNHAVLEGLDALHVVSEFDLLQDAKELARARFDVVGADLRKLGRAKLAATRYWGIGEEQNVELGPKPADLTTITALQRWLQSERALCTTKAEHLAALERHWTHAFIIERITKQQFDAKNTGITRYLPVKYLLLTATQEWNRARKEMKP